MLARLLAEVLRIQRWAGGDHIPADQIFGLMHGFESAYRDGDSFGVSIEVQRKVENILQDVEFGRQSTDGMSIKDRLYEEEIDETVAGQVMELCRLQSRWLDGINKIVEGQGSVFAYLKARHPVQGWFGALHYMELMDCTEGSHKKLHAVYAPTVPRVGEIVTPENGSPMQVVGVEYIVVEDGEDEGIKQPYLVPYVLLEADDEDEGEEA